VLALNFPQKAGSANGAVSQEKTNVVKKQSKTKLILFNIAQSLVKVKMNTKTNVPEMK
jgi:hypothetical protein